MQSTFLELPYWWKWIIPCAWTPSDKKAWHISFKRNSDFHYIEETQSDYHWQNHCIIILLYINNYWGTYLNHTTSMKQNPNPMLLSLTNLQPMEVGKIYIYSPQKRSYYVSVPIESNSNWNVNSNCLKPARLRVLSLIIKAKGPIYKSSSGLKLYWSWIFSLMDNNF